MNSFSLTEDNESGKIYCFEAELNKVNARTGNEKQYALLIFISDEELYFAINQESIISLSEINDEKLKELKVVYASEEVNEIERDKYGAVYVYLRGLIE